MKCTFNGQLRSEDTILLHLYKRVFPKWTYNTQVPILPPVIYDDDDDDDDDEDEEIADEEEPKGQAFKLFD